MSEEASRASRQLPLLIGGLCVALGLAVGLWPAADDEGDAPTPSPTATATATASPSAAAETPLAAYRPPDLGGPDVGEVVVASAVDATGLAVVEDRLWWLATEGATLARSRLDGGEPLIIHAPEDAGAIGGAFATGDDAVYFTVTDAGAIYRVSAHQKEAANPAPFATGSSPEPLAVTRDAVFWVDGDGLWRRENDDEGPEKTATLSGVVTGLAARRAGVVWLEAPISPSAHHALRSHDENGTRQLATLDPAGRDNLAVAGNAVYWAESRPVGGEDRGHLVRFEDGGFARTLRVSGLVSHLTVVGEKLIWTEVYGDVDEATTLLFTAGLEGEDVTRHGRIPGLVTALAAHGDVIYWSGARGIERLRLAP